MNLQSLSNEQLLLTALDGSGWLAALACRIVDGRRSRIAGLRTRVRGEAQQYKWQCRCESIHQE